MLGRSKLRELTRASAVAKDKTMGCCGSSGDFPITAEKDDITSFGAGKSA
jgi:hypothetical protein